MVDRRKLWNGYLVVKFLLIRAVILVVRKLTLVCAVMASFSTSKLIAFLFFKIFLELEIWWASPWELCRQMFLFSGRVGNILGTWIKRLLFLVAFFLLAAIIHRWPSFRFINITYFLKNFQLFILYNVGNILEYFF